MGAGSYHKKKDAMKSPFGDMMKMKKKGKGKKGKKKGFMAGKKKGGKKAYM